MDLAGGMTAVDLALEPWMTFQDMALPMDLDLDPCMTVLVGMTTIALDLALTLALAQDTAQLMTTMHHMETFP